MKIDKKRLYILFAFVTGILLLGLFFIPVTYVGTLQDVRQADGNTWQGMLPRKLPYKLHHIYKTQSDSGSDLSRLKLFENGKALSLLQGVQAGTAELKPGEYAREGQYLFFRPADSGLSSGSGQIYTAEIELTLRIRSWFLILLSGFALFAVCYRKVLFVAVQSLMAACRRMPVLLDGLHGRLFFLQDRFSNTVLMRRVAWALPIGVLFASTIFPRLMLLGGLPATDEGFYAYQAQLIHHSIVAGQGLPDTGYLALYPMLLTWVFALDFNPMILLRTADLFVAVLAIFLLYCVLVDESKSRVGGALLTLVFAFVMNQPIFIQSGFKNSMMAAFVPLLLAMRISQKSQRSSRHVWFIVGALVALAVLLRETFAPFALLGFIALLIGRNWRDAFRFAMGGIAAGTGIVAAILFLRGGITQLVEAYRNEAIRSSFFAHHRLDLFCNNGLSAAREAIVPLFLSALAILILCMVSIRYRNRQVFFRFLFWLAVAVLPIIEPAAKIGFPYHFSVCLLGLSGICALTWREVSCKAPRMKWVLPTICAIAFLLLTNRISGLIYQWPDTKEALVALPSGRWPAGAAEKSNYLLATEAISKAIPPNGTLSVSGVMYALYPLTGHLPPHPSLSNLTATMMELGLSQSRMQQVLLSCPADVIMTTSRGDMPGKMELLAAIKASGIYEEVAEIENSKDRAYGTFGGTVFRRTEYRPCVISR